MFTLNEQFSSNHLQDDCFIRSGQLIFSLSRARVEILIFMILECAESIKNIQLVSFFER